MGIVRRRKSRPFFRSHLRCYRSVSKNHCVVIEFIRRYSTISPPYPLTSSLRSACTLMYLRVSSWRCRPCNPTYVVIPCHPCTIQPKHYISPSSELDGSCTRKLPMSGDLDLCAADQLQQRLGVLWQTRIMGVALRKISPSSSPESHSRSSSRSSTEAAQIDAPISFSRVRHLYSSLERLLPHSRFRKFIDHF